MQTRTRLLRWALIRNGSISLGLLLAAFMVINGPTVFGQHDHGSHDHGAHMHPVDAQQHAEAMALVSDALATHVAVTSGTWTDAAVWGGVLPTDGARVVIPAGITVTVDSVLPTALKTVRVDGVLRFATTTNTQMRVDTLISSPRSLLEIGTATAPVQPNVTAQVLFTDFGPVAVAADPGQWGRGALLHGKTVIYGSQKTAWTTLAVHPRAGETLLTLTAPPVGWAVGDMIVVAATDPNNPESDDKVQILAIEGTSVLIDRPLTFDHVPPVPDLNVHVANLTRNVIFASENPTVQHRGHIMFMHTLDVDVNNVRFFQLGRTDKRVRIDDATFPDLEEDGSFVPGERTNIRGRYSVHFHRGGAAPDLKPAVVRGSVVEDDPGWAYVNHSSTVDFIDNVSYNIIGGAYQTEAGDEFGSFINNIALRTVNPNHPLTSPGEDILVDIREDAQDFAFQGDGFWLHGGGPRIEGNVVAGATGHAYIYWTEGLIEAHLGMMRVPTTHLPNGHLIHNKDMVHVWWMPISSFRDNTAYSAVKGLEIYYLHATFLGGEDDDPDSHDRSTTEAHKAQLNSTFENLTFWNMGQHAIGFNYSEDITMRNVRIVGDGDPNVIGVDADHFHLLNDYRFENFTIEGMGLGMNVPTNGNIVIEGGTFANAVDFRISNPQLYARNLTFNNISFADSPFFAEQTPFLMEPDLTHVAQIQ
ncbi:MAG: G8 domain-containing protein, partial [Chloroflexota bacterium]